MSFYKFHPLYNSICRPIDVTLFLNICLPAISRFFCLCIFFFLRFYILRFITQTQQGNKVLLLVVGCNISFIIVKVSLCQRISIQEKKNLEKNEAILKSQQKFKNEAHSIFTEKVNKILLSAGNGKTLQTLNGVISYSYATGVGRVCKTEVLRYAKKKDLV